MNYTSFCDYLLAALTDQLESGTTITKETIRKNNGVMLDALIIRLPNSASSPVIYLDSLYQTYKNGSSIQKIAQQITARLHAELPISQELAGYDRSLDAVRDRIVFRLISRKDNSDLLSDVPWVPILDLAVIFCIHFGVREETQITSVIHNQQAEAWNLSPSALYQIAKINTPRICPGMIRCLEDMLFGCDQENNCEKPCNSPVPTLYLLTNPSGIYGASCLLYEGIIKDFADRMESDLIILPSSIHEVLILTDDHEQDYHMFRNMVRHINANDVSKEDILSDELYLYRRGDTDMIRWSSCSSDNIGRSGTENL